MPSTERLVLVVDDDADIREALREALEQDGYAVAEARDGSAALGYLRAHPAPPLILLDWNMAPMNGARFLEELARDPQLAAIPVVLLTADSRVDAKARPGLAGHLIKPVELEVLFEVVAKFCS